MCLMRPGRSVRSAAVISVRSAAAIVAVSASLVSVPPVVAGPATDQLKASVDNVIRLLEDPAARADHQARRVALRRVADNIFDFQEIAKRSLGPHWQKLSDKEREEFVALFGDLLERAYASKIEKYSGEKITYAGEVVDNDQVTVKTRFSTKQGSEVPIDYRMLRRGDGWRAYDVTVEGVSLVANYRSQFDKILASSSYAELVSRLKNSPDPGSTTGGVKRKDSTPRS